MSSTDTIAMPQQMIRKYLVRRLGSAIWVPRQVRPRQWPLLNTGLTTFCQNSLVMYAVYIL